MSAHLHTHWGRSLSALPSPVLQTKIFLCPLKTWKRAPGSWSAHPLRCKYVRSCSIYPLLLGMLCSAQVPTESTNWGQWELMHGNVIPLLHQAGSWGRQTLLAVLGQGCQGLKADHSPVAQESNLHIKPVRSPFLTKWYLDVGAYPIQSLKK